MAGCFVYGCNVFNVIAKIAVILVINFGCPSSKFVRECNSIDVSMDVIHFDGFYTDFSMDLSARSVPVCSSVYHSSNLLLWSRPFNQTPFKPRTGKRYTNSFIAILLLTIESNPGPTVSPLTFASWNIRSAVNKAANVHDIITDHNIDILALNET